MPFELRIAGKPPARFDTEPEAVAAASAALADNPDAEPELIDLSTDQPAAPAADQASREDLRKAVG